MGTEHVEQYYTSTERLLEIFDREGRKLRFLSENLQEYLAWKTEVREKLSELTGLARMERCEPVLRTLESVEMDGYRRDKLLLMTEPGVFMPFYVLIPQGMEPGERRACVITPHGHGGGGKLAVAGRKDIPAVDRAIEDYNYAYGVRFVREGYLVFCPDARAFGERREWPMQGDDPEQYLHSSCVALNHIALSLGRSVTGMWTWDLMRLTDYVLSRQDCNGKVACAGLSGGGLQTLWLTAMDDRIACAVVSGYFYGYRDSLLKLSNNCGCNYVPHLWEYVDMADLGALIAPRPLLIESGLQDSLNGERGIANVNEQVEDTRRAYRLLGAEQNLRQFIFDGGHKWVGEETYTFVREGLTGC